MRHGDNRTGSFPRSWLCGLSIFCLFTSFRRTSFAIRGREHSPWFLVSVRRSVKRQTAGQDMKLLDTGLTYVRTSYVPAGYDLPKVTRRYESACTKMGTIHTR
jgi:hypothetical protein